ncbi:MAG: flavodoxin family protein [candidate division Zixibacteria bacterium]|nr:flavodoxin family protein [candidate division Zixibacteria bacterium]
MIKLLTISGSPVTDSSTDLLLHQIADTFAANTGEKHQVDHTFVKLNDLKYIACQSCSEDPSPKFCLYDDDLTDIYEKLAECDCLLFGSPVYFDSVSAQAKMFIDRCNCFRPPDYDNTDPENDFIKRLKKKRPGAIILVGGERGWFEGARRVIAGFFKWVEVVNEGVLIYRSHDFRNKGTASDDRTAMMEAEQLGFKLAKMITKHYD